MKLPKRELRYCNITGKNLDKRIKDMQSSLHVWKEELGGQVLLVGYMYDAEIPAGATPMDAPKEPKRRQKQTDGGMFNIPPDEDPFPPTTPQEDGRTLGDRLLATAMREARDDIPKG